MTRAPAPTRTYETATLSVGLLTIPISVYAGTVSEHGIKRKWFTKDGHEVGYVTQDKETNAPYPRSEIVNKIMTEYGAVYVEDHEIESLFDVTPKTITVKAIQPQHFFTSGTYVGKKPYTVEVTKTKIGSKKVPNKAAEQAFALVLEALEREGALAYVEFVTRGTPKPAVLLSDGSLWELFYEDELRERRPLPEVELPEAVVEQGVALLKALWSLDPIDTTDHRSALIQDFADKKAEAGEFGEPGAAAPVAAQRDSSNDLLAMLAASVEAAQTSRAAG